LPDFRAWSTTLRAAGTRREANREHESYVRRLGIAARFPRRTERLFLGKPNLREGAVGALHQALERRARARWRALAPLRDSGAAHGRPHSGAHAAPNRLGLRDPGLLRVLRLLQPQYPVFRVLPPARVLSLLPGLEILPGGGVPPALRVHAHRRGRKWAARAGDRK